MCAFLVGIFCLCFKASDILWKAFSYNTQINTIILLFIVFGVYFAIRIIFQYNVEYSMLMSCENLANPNIKKLKLLAPIDIHANKRLSTISQPKTHLILDGIEKKIDSLASIPKYISGTLIFLGLLGTFWGLSQTIGNVADIIDKLGIGQQDAAESFLTLKNSLKIPLTGMGTAFGCSLFGLSGSLVIGFLLALQKRVTEDFIDKVEQWLSRYSTGFGADASDSRYHGPAFSMTLLEKTTELIYVFQKQIDDINTTRISYLNFQKDFSVKFAKLTEAISAIQQFAKIQTEKDIVWGDISEKLSSIHSSITTMTQESTRGNKMVIDALGSDIRMISKTLSTLMR
jgi:hypothetical protein